VAQPQNTSRKKIWVTFGLAVGLGAFALFNDLPHSSSAAGGGPLDEFVLYGIGSQSGSLVRYQFSDGTLSTVGTVSNSTTTMTGIQASAYVPRNSNIFTFWNDPSDGQTKLVYVNATTAKAAIVGQPMGTGSITAAVAAMPTPSTFTLTPDQATPAPDVIQYGIYAVKAADSIPFDIIDDEVVPAASFATKITVLGAAIVSGSDDIPVTTKINIGTDTFEPWGSFGQPVNGNVNDDAYDEISKTNNWPSSRSYVIPNTYPLGTPITLTAQSWSKVNRGLNGSQNSDWSSNLAVNSSASTPQLITLRNGDAVPNIAGFNNQASLVTFIANYIDSNTNTVVLSPNQAIYLFELGTTNLNSAAADFQDLVVLVTLGKDPAELVTGTSNEPVAHLINVDPRNAMYTEVMPLSRLYDGLAATSAQMFYGTYNGELYAIDPSAGTETLIGTLSYSQNVEAFGNAGNTFYGFTRTANQLRAIDPATGQIIGTDINTGITGLGSLSMIRLADEPQLRNFD